MDPFFARNRLSAYIDGALPEREASEVAEAIARDPELQAEYDALRAAVSALRQHGPVSAPEGFKARVMASVEREPTQGGVVIQLRRFFTRVPIEALAVAAAALLVVFATASQMQDATPDPIASVPVPPAKSKDAVDAPVPKDAPPEDVRAATATDTPEKKEVAPQSKEAAPEKRKSITPQAAGSTGDAYVPEWEAQQKADGAAFGGTEGMTLSVSDPDVLGKLYFITERAGGRMVDEASQPLSPYGLSADDPVARVLLLVPVDQAPTLRGQLEGLGAVAGPSPTGAPTLAAGYTGFYVETRLLTEKK